MNKKEWLRVFEHPYRDIQAATATHSQLKPTTVRVPPYSTFAVPFWWLRRSNQKAIQESLAGRRRLHTRAAQGAPNL